MKTTLFPLLLTLTVLFSCNINDTQQQPTGTGESTVIDSSKRETAKPAEEPMVPVKYRFIKKEEWLALKDSFEGIRHPDILHAINRVDAAHLKRLDSILVPDDYNRPFNDYLPFPTTVDLLKNVKKIILFSYPAQVFAAYEGGNLTRTGPTSMGRKTKPTPQKLYFTNWKAKKTISTVDNAWILKWNFNVHNRWGVGFHEYALPGYPASHSCMRLLEADAQFLYGWAEQWVLQNDQLAASGTPVIVFGQYPFGKPRPWHELVNNPTALNLSADSLKQYIEPHLEDILKKQEERLSIPLNKG